MLLSSRQRSLFCKSQSYKCFCTPVPTTIIDIIEELYCTCWYVMKKAGKHDYKFCLNPSLSLSFFVPCFLFVLFFSSHLSSCHNLIFYSPEQLCSTCVPPPTAIFLLDRTQAKLIDQSRDRISRWRAARKKRREEEKINKSV